MQVADHPGRIGRGWMRPENTGEHVSVTRRKSKQRLRRQRELRRASRRQLGLICHLADVLRFDPVDLSAWLSRHFDVPSVAAIRDAKQARRIIAALTRIRAWRENRT